MNTLSKLSLSLLLSEGRFSCVKAASLLESLSHDQLTRLYHKESELSQLLTPWETLPQPGYLVVDDTVIDKRHAKQIEGVRHVYSSLEKKVLPGLSLFLAVWVHEEKAYPLYIGFPQGCKKHDLFQDILNQIDAAGITPDRVLFDSWYASAQNLKAIHRKGWSYVCGIRENRIFKGQALTQQSFPGAESKCGSLKGLDHSVCVVKYHDRFLLTNEIQTWMSRQLAVFYRKRWVIESVFRALKQVCHLEKCQCRTLQAQFNHVMAAIGALNGLRSLFPEMGPELAQREFLRQIRAKQLTPEQILPLVA